MSTFDERKTEILRRSEERIRIRRGRKKKIAVICAPLCAVALSFAAYFSLTNAQSSIDSDTAPETPVARYEIKDSAKLAYMLNEIFTADSTDGTEEVLLPTSSLLGSSQSIFFVTREEKECEIVLQNGDSETVYKLSGHSLTNLDTGDEVLLDDEQLNSILSIIDNE